MQGRLARLFATDEVPYGSRVITMATAVYWIGWGFAESLIPVMLYMFGHSFAGAGILRSTYDIAYIVAMPLVGLYADKVRASTLILIGLYLYVLIGGSYFLAGATGLAAFIVLARFLNGVSYSLTSVGREAYFRRHSPAEKLGAVFGYFDTVANLAWTLAAIAGIWLVRYIPIHWLLLAITPASIVALFIMVRFRQDAKRNPVLEHHGTGKIRELYLEVRGLNRQLGFLVFFNFFVSFANAVVTFFVPVEAYAQGASFTVVILTGVAATIPSLFGFFLGKWFDKAGLRAMVYSMIAFGLMLLTLSFFDSFTWKIALSLIVAFLVEILTIGWKKVATMHTSPDHYGKIDGIFKSIADIGALIGPIVAGAAIDMLGGHAMFGILGVTLAVIGVMFSFIFKKPKTPARPIVLEEPVQA